MIEIKKITIGCYLKFNDEPINVKAIECDKQGFWINYGIKEQVLLTDCDILPITEEILSTNNFINLEHGFEKEIDLTNKIVLVESQGKFYPMLYECGESVYDPEYVVTLSAITSVHELQYICNLYDIVITV